MVIDSSMIAGHFSSLNMEEKEKGKEGRVMMPIN